MVNIHIINLVALQRGRQKQSTHFIHIYTITPTVLRRSKQILSHDIFLTSLMNIYSITPIALV